MEEGIAVHLNPVKGIFYQVYKVQKDPYQRNQSRKSRKKRNPMKCIRSTKYRNTLLFSWILYWSWKKGKGDCFQSNSKQFFKSDNKQRFFQTGSIPFQTNSTFTVRENWYGLVSYYMVVVMHCSSQKSHLKWALIYLYRRWFNFPTQSSKSHLTLTFRFVLLPIFTWLYQGKYILNLIWWFMTHVYSDFIFMFWT